MNLKDALREGIEILKNAANVTPAVEAGVILSCVIKQDRIYIYTHDDSKLSHSEQDLYFELINKRAQGMPLQYITGHQEFMSLDFKVNQAVLIPRQDTETLVEAVIKHSKSLGNGLLEILDMGTGSGCIAISLAKYIESCHVTAVDKSVDALETAKLNALNVGVIKKITFVQSNLFEKLDKRYDIIVSNPPYIRTTQIGELQTEIKDYEPLTALDGGETGLDFYRAITGKAVGFLKPGGILAFEVGYDQAYEVSKMMEKDFYNVESIKDMAKVDRVVKGFFLNKSQ